MTNHDFNEDIPSDIEYALSRIGAIADSIDSSMTVGEIVQRAYLCGVGDTLDEFRRLIDRRTFVDSAIDGSVTIDEIGAMVRRDGRIASMLTHPVLDRPAMRRDLEFPGRLRIGAEVNAMIALIIVSASVAVLLTVWALCRAAAAGDAIAERLSKSRSLKEKGSGL